MIKSPYPLTVTTSLIFGSRGQFSELDQSAVATSREVGTWRTLAPNVIRIVVEDWDPKQMYSVSQGYIPVRKPANAIDRVTFTSPSTMTLQDTTLGGAMPCRRT